MRIHDVEQGSQAWLSARLGIPTASAMGQLMTPGGKASKQVRAYALRLAAERLLRQSADPIDHLDAVARGKELEPQAVKLLELVTGVETRGVGFCTTDDGRIGCSPDRLAGDDGLVEIKAPAAATHLGYLADGFGEQYRPQVQGQLMVTGRAWCDWVSYHPELPLVVIRIERDEPYIAQIAEGCERVIAERDRILAAALEAGAIPREAGPALTAYDQAYADAGMDWSRDDLP